MPQEGWGDLVRRYRRLRKLTQAQLAEAASMDPSYVGKIEAGDVPRPEPDTVRRLATPLAAPMSAFARALGWIDDEPAEPLAEAEAAILALDLSEDEKTAIITLLRARSPRTDQRRAG